MGVKSRETSWMRTPVDGSTDARVAPAGVRKERRQGSRGPGDGHRERPGAAKPPGHLPGGIDRVDHAGVGRRDEQRAEREDGQARGARGEERPERDAAGRIEGGHDRARNHEQGASGWEEDPAAAARVLRCGSGPEDCPAPEIAPLQERAADEDENPVPAAASRRRAVPAFGALGGVEADGSIPTAGREQAARSEQAVAGRWSESRSRRGAGRRSGAGDRARGAAGSRRAGSHSQAAPQGGRPVALPALDHLGERRRGRALQVGEETVPGLGGRPAPHHRAEVGGALEDGLGEGEGIAPDRWGTVHRHDPSPTVTRAVEFRPGRARSKVTVAPGDAAIRDEAAQRSRKSRYGAPSTPRNSSPAGDRKQTRPRTSREARSAPVPLPGGQAPGFVLDLEAAGGVPRPAAGAAGAAARTCPRVDTAMDGGPGRFAQEAAQFGDGPGTRGDLGDAGAEPDGRGAGGLGQPEGPPPPRGRGGEPAGERVATERRASGSRRCRRSSTAPSSKGTERVPPPRQGERGADEQSQDALRERSLRPPGTRLSTPSTSTASTSTMNRMAAGRGSGAPARSPARTSDRRQPTLRRSGMRQSRPSILQVLELVDMGLNPDTVTDHPRRPPSRKYQGILRLHDLHRSSRRGAEAGRQATPLPKIAEIAIRENLLDHVGKIPRTPWPTSWPRTASCRGRDRAVVVVQHRPSPWKSGPARGPGGTGQAGRAATGRRACLSPRGSITPFRRGSSRGQRGGMREGGGRRREEGDRGAVVASRRRRRSPYEILAGAERPLTLRELASLGAERMLMPDAFVRDAGSLAAALQEDNRRREAAGRKPVFALHPRGERHPRRRSRTGDRRRPVVAVRVPASATEMRRTALAALRRRLRSADGFVTVEYLVARLLDASGLKEVRVAKRGRDRRGVHRPPPHVGVRRRAARHPRCCAAGAT